MGKYYSKERVQLKCATWEIARRGLFIAEKKNTVVEDIFISGITFHMSVNMKMCRAGKSTQL